MVKDGTFHDERAEIDATLPLSLNLPAHSGLPRTPDTLLLLRHRSVAVLRLQCLVYTSRQQHATPPITRR